MKVVLPRIKEILQSHGKGCIFGILALQNSSILINLWLFGLFNYFHFWMEYFIAAELAFIRCAYMSRGREELDNMDFSLQVTKEPHL